MTRQVLKEEILSLTRDIQFEYKGVNGLIMPYSDDDFMLCYGDNSKSYTNIDDVMSDKFFDGMSLNELCDVVDFD